MHSKRLMRHIGYLNMPGELQDFEIEMPEAVFIATVCILHKRKQENRSALKHICNRI
jgi:hypothetical protein